MRRVIKLAHARYDCWFIKATYDGLLYSTSFGVILFTVLLVYLCFSLPVCRRCEWYYFIDGRPKSSSRATIHVLNITKISTKSDALRKLKAIVADKTSGCSMCVTSGSKSITAEKVCKTDFCVMLAHCLCLQNVHYNCTFINVLSKFNQTQSV